LFKLVFKPKVNQLFENDGAINNNCVYALKKFSSKNNQKMSINKSKSAEVFSKIYHDYKMLI